MTRLVHLTDLHFGMHRTDLVDPLRRAVRATGPDFVVASGDVSHRARARQFAEGMAFLESLGRPFLNIPGNHDMPLYNIVARCLDPFGGYRRRVSRELFLLREVGEVRLFGINTADPWSWREGVVRPAEIEAFRRHILDGAAGMTNILVTHHPFAVPSGFHRGETRGAAAALRSLAEAGLHLILSGHLHHWTIGLGMDSAPRTVFQLQTGSALCRREGERDLGFATLDVTPDRLEVTPWIAPPDRPEYLAGETRRYDYRDGLWHARDVV